MWEPLLRAGMLRLSSCLEGGSSVQGAHLNIGCQHRVRESVLPLMTVMSAGYPLIDLTL